MTKELLYVVISFVIIIWILYSWYSRKIGEVKNEHDILNKNLEDKYKSLIERVEYERTKVKNQLHRESENLKLRENKLNEILSEKNKLFTTLDSFSNKSVEKITSLFADYTLLQYNLSAKFLRQKSRPALKEAKRIAELKKQTKKYLEQYKYIVVQI